MAYVGSAPAACRATVSNEVVVVLPWVPATATTRRPVHQRGQRGRARDSTREPARGWPRRTRGCPRGPRSTTTTVSASSRCAAAWPTCTVAPRARSASRVGDVDAVAAADRDAAGQHDPGDPGQPGAADADEVHPAEPLGREELVRHGRLISGALQHDPRQLLVGVARDQRRGGALIAASRSASATSAGTFAVTHARRERRVGDEQRSPGVDDRPGVELLLAVADRQRHEDGGYADRGGLGDAARRRPGRPSGRRRRGRSPSGRRSDRRRRGHRPASGRPRRSWGRPRAAPARRPRPARGRRRRRPSLMLRAPCEPPVTTRVGRSASRPKNARASARSAAPVEAGRSSGGSAGRRTPRAGSVVSGKLTATRRAIRAPTLLARPGSAFCSWTTSGILRRRAAR